MSLIVGPGGALFGTTGELQQLIVETTRIVDAVNRLLARLEPESEIAAASGGLADELRRTSTNLLFLIQSGNYQAQLMAHGLCDGQPAWEAKRAVFNAATAGFDVDEPEEIGIGEDGRGRFHPMKRVGRWLRRSSLALKAADIPIGSVADAIPVVGSAYRELKETAEVNAELYPELDEPPPPAPSVGVYDPDDPDHPDDDPDDDRSRVPLFDQDDLDLTGEEARALFGDGYLGSW